MSEQVKRGPGRPKKGAQESALTEDITLLREALLAARAELEAYKTAASLSGGARRVTLKATGLVQLCIPIPNEPTLVLEAGGSRETGSVPVEVYENLKRNTDWFTKGYVVVVGQEENSNVVLDPADWVKHRTEKRVREDIRTMTSEGSLWRLWDYAEAKGEDRTGKDLIVMQEVAARCKELFDYDLVEDTSGFED